MFGKEVRLPDGRVFLTGSTQYSIEKLSVAVSELLLELDNEQGLPPSETFSAVPSCKPLLMAAAQPIMHELPVEDVVPHMIVLCDGRRGGKELAVLTSGIEEELRRCLEHMCDTDVLEQHIAAPRLDALQTDLADMNAVVISNGIKDRLPQKKRHDTGTWSTGRRYSNGRQQTIRPKKNI